jgi:biotin transporter BioY
LVVFVCGVSWLSSIIGINDAITFGVIPFIIPGALKAVMLSGCLRFIRPGKRANG